MFTLDNLFLLLTGLIAAYLCWYFWRRYNLHKALHILQQKKTMAVDVGQIAPNGVMLTEEVIDSAEAMAAALHFADELASTLHDSALRRSVSGRRGTWRDT